MKPTIVVIAMLLLVSCGNDHKPKINHKEEPTFSVYEAAVSGDGLAVGASYDGLVINDGGSESRYPLHGVLLKLTPSETGVWVSGTNTVMFVSRGGVTKYKTSSFLSDILPVNGSSAYIIDDGKLIYLGTDKPVRAKPLKRPEQNNSGDTYERDYPDDRY